MLQCHNHMDYTKTPISFDPCQLHLRLIEQAVCFSIIPCPLPDVDIQAIPDDSLKCILSFEWQGRICGFQSALKQTFSWVQANALSLCRAEVLLFHSRILGMGGPAACEAINNLR